MPHHRVGGQRASGGIGSVSQLSLNKERSGGFESTVRGGEHAETPQGQHAKSARGSMEHGSMRRGPWVLANRQEPRGRKVWINPSPWMAVVPLLTTRW